MFGFGAMHIFILQTDEHRDTVLTTIGETKNTALADNDNPSYPKFAEFYIFLKNNVLHNFNRYDVTGCFLSAVYLNRMPQPSLDSIRGECVSQP